MLNQKQVAERYGVEEATIERWLREGQFPKPSVHTGLWDEENLKLFEKRSGEFFAELMQLDEAGKADPTWTTDRDMIIKLLKDTLGLPDDVSDQQLLSKTLSLLDACAKVKNLLGKKQS